MITGPIKRSTPLPSSNVVQKFELQREANVPQFLDRLHPFSRQSLKIFNTGYIILISCVKRKFCKTYVYFIYEYSSLKGGKMKNIS